MLTQEHRPGQDRIGQARHRQAPLLHPIEEGQHVSAQLDTLEVGPVELVGFTLHADRRPELGGGDVTEAGRAVAVGDLAGVGDTTLLPYVPDEQALGVATGVPDHTDAAKHQEFEATLACLATVSRMLLEDLTGPS